MSPKGVAEGLDPWVGCDFSQKGQWDGMKKREGQAGVGHLCPSSWATLVPVRVQATGRNSHIFPIKGVSDTLTGKHVPGFSADHQKGEVPVLADARKGQGSVKGGCTWQIAEFFIPSSVAG